MEKTTNDTGNTVQSPHDKLFKQYFSEREVALSFIEQNLPKNILDHVDPETFKISKDTFVDKHLADFIEVRIFYRLQDLM